MPLGYTAIFGGNLAILSTMQVLKRLKISKAGLYKWVKSGKIKYSEFQWGDRILKGFKDTDVDALAKRIKKNREPGKSLLEEK